MKNIKGFTLVEVLATIVILSILLLIAVPSVTKLQEASNIKQIESDAKIFVELVRQKIESDTSINIAVGDSKDFRLNDIDKTKLSSSAYLTSSKVTASDCGYKTNDIYTCDTFVVTLENDSYKASIVSGKIKGQKK